MIINVLWGVEGHMGESLIEDWALYAVDTDICPLNDFLEEVAYSYSQNEMFDMDNTLGIEQIANGYQFNREEMEDVIDDIKYSGNNYDNLQAELVRRLGYDVDEYFTDDDLIDRFPDYF